MCRSLYAAVALLLALTATPAIAGELQYWHRVGLSPQAIGYNDHESAHQQANDLRNLLNVRDHMPNEGPGRWNASAFMNGWAHVLPEPNITLADVAAAIPQQYRGPSYKEYFQTKLKDWPGQRSLYVIDEQAAFCAGAAQTPSATYPPKQHRTQCEVAVEFRAYAAALVRTQQRLDPGYSEAIELERYVRQINQWTTEHVLPVLPTQ